MLDETIRNIDFSGCQTYRDQLAKVNFTLWPLMLPKEVRATAPNLLTLGVEEFEAVYLAELIRKRDSFIVDFLFDEAKRKRIQEIFEGSTGAWNHTRGSGTDFFWKITNGKMEQLTLHGNVLRDEQGAYELTMEPSVIAQELEHQQILPCMLLTYAVTVFWCGIRSLAGMGSIQYVSEMKRKWIQYLEEIHSTEVELIKHINTQLLVVASINFSRVHSMLRQDSAFDLLFQGGKPLTYYQQLAQIPYKYLQYPTLPVSYQYYIPKGGTFPVNEQELLKPFAWIQ